MNIDEGRIPTTTLKKLDSAITLTAFLLAMTPTTQIFDLFA